MPNGLCALIQRFLRDDQRGNVAIILALAIIPLIGAAGAALDYVRASNAHAELQAALDSGVLAAVHNLNGDDTATKALLKQEIAAHIQATGLPAKLVGDVTLEVDVTTNGVAASASGRVATTLLAVLQIKTLPVSAQSATIIDSGSVEIALALDTTGSMAGHMGDLRAAAQQLVDIISAKGRNRNAKVALVPYVGAVNIGNAPAHEAWLDKAGTSKHHAQAIRNMYIASIPPCGEYSPPQSGGGGKLRDGQLQGAPFDAIRTGLQELLGVRPASAAAAYAAIEEGCLWKNPPEVSHWRLLQGLSNASWKGCVEARPEPYDVDDTPPSAGRPDTLWVPYFWPDGPDGDNAGFVEGINNYMPDAPFIAGSDMEQGGFGRAYSVLKYDGRPALVDEVGPDTRGPNRACPDPVLPLTNDYATISSRIASLNYYADSGTNSADGVAWGMRLLSPAPPFTEGTEFGKVPKILVLLSDGQNEILKDPGGENLDDPLEDGGAFISHYSAYGTIRAGRFPQPTFDSAYAYLDERMEAACANAKDAGIELFVIAYGVEQSALAGLARCASDASHLIEVGKGGSLEQAFQAVAAKIMPIRLTR